MDKIDRTWKVSLGLNVELVPRGDGLVIQIKSDKDEVVATVPVPWDIIEQLRVEGAWGPARKR